MVFVGLCDGSQEEAVYVLNYINVLLVGHTVDSVGVFTTRQGIQYIFLFQEDQDIVDLSSGAKDIQ